VAILDDTRDDWHAQPPTRALTAVPHRSRTGVAWHWAGPAVHLFGKGHGACLDQVREWQRQHQRKGWADLGYPALVCVHARAIEGRGLSYAGAHSPSWNVSRWGVQFMVGEGEHVTAAMHARAQKLRAALAELAGHPLLDAPHRGDPDAETACPGDEIAAWVAKGGPTPPPRPRPTPPPTTRRESMHTLVQQSGHDAVWISDLITRRHIANPAELVAVKAALRARGVSDTVQVVKSLTPYGVVVGADPSNRVVQL
jgi:hypothetical protein